MMVDLQEVASRTLADRTRLGANLVFAAAQPVISLIWRAAERAEPESERARDVQGPVTPAPGAFAIWAPLFVASLAYSALSTTDRYRDDPTLEQVGWLSAAAFAGDSLWSANAQFRDLGWTSLGLIAGTAGAAASATILAERAQPRTDGAWLVGWTLAPLAGWLLVASFANAEAALNTRLGRPDPDKEDMRAIGLIAAASFCAAGLAFATRGNLPLAAAAGWGFGGVALKNSRERRKTISAAAFAGLAALGLASWVARRSRATR